MPDIETMKRDVISFYEMMFNNCRPKEAIARYAGDDWAAGAPTRLDSWPKLQCVGAIGLARGSTRFSIHAAVVDFRSNVWFSRSKILPCRILGICASQAMVPFLRRRFMIVSMICNMAFQFTTFVVNAAGNGPE